MFTQFPEDSDYSFEYTFDESVMKHVNKLIGKENYKKNDKKKNSIIISEFYTSKLLRPVKDTDIIGFQLDLAILMCQKWDCYDPFQKEVYYADIRCNEYIKHLSDKIIKRNMFPALCFNLRAPTNVLLDIGSAEKWTLIYDLCVDPEKPETIIPAKIAGIILTDAINAENDNGRRLASILINDMQSWMSTVVNHNCKEGCDDACKAAKREKMERAKELLLGLK